MKVEAIHDRGEVGRKRVIFVAGPGLIGPAEAPAIVHDDAKAVFCQADGLMRPHVAVERPPMDQDHRPSRSPVIVEGPNTIRSRDECHVLSPYDSVIRSDLLGTAKLRHARRFVPEQTMLLDASPERIRVSL